MVRNRWGARTKRWGVVRNHRGVFPGGWRVARNRWGAFPGGWGVVHSRWGPVRDGWGVLPNHRGKLPNLKKTLKTVFYLSSEKKSRFFEVEVIPYGCCRKFL